MAKTRTTTVLGYETTVSIKAGDTEVVVPNCIFIEDQKVWLDLNAILEAAKEAKNA